MTGTVSGSPFHSRGSWGGKGQLLRNAQNRFLTSFPWEGGEKGGSGARRLWREKEALRAPASRTSHG